MLEKIKSFTGKIGKKGKAMLFAAIMAVSTCAMTVAASAAEVSPLAENGEASGTGVDFGTMMSEAGDTLISTFGQLIKIMIPVVMGILSSGLVIFGIIALVKLAKKIFGKVAG